MHYFKKPNKSDVIVTACVFVWIFIVNVAAVVLELHSWPLFLVTIFFFAMHADTRQIPNIFVGGTLGLLSALALARGLVALSPAMGELGAFALLIGVILAVIILGGTVCPLACNNVAFAYLTVATVNIHELTPAGIGNNLLVLWLGGAVILGGAILFSKIGMKLAAPRARAKTE